MTLGETKEEPAARRILCVDDEPRVLAGLARTLGMDYDVTTAVGPEEGLALLRRDPGFAVIISDLKMPGMDGIEFLTASRDLVPDAVRILLTGYADVQSSIRAVNQGHVFRFMTKPCPPADLRLAIDAALRQHDLVAHERVLLEQTLRGCMTMFSVALEFANPDVFGRASRLRQLAAATFRRTGRELCWETDVAAMLVVVPFATLPSETATRHARGAPLSEEERAMVDRLPAQAEQLVASIPRMDGVQRILRYATRRFDGVGPPPADDRAGADIPLGSRVLKLVWDFAALEDLGNEAVEVVRVIRGRAGWYDPDLVEALVEEMRETGVRAREAHLADMRPGLIIVEDVYALTGMVVVAKGHEVTPKTLQRLQNFADRAGLREPMMVIEPIR